MGDHKCEPAFGKNIDGMVVSPRAPKSHGLPEPRPALEELGEVVTVREAVKAKRLPAAYMASHGLGEQLNPILKKYAGVSTSADAASLVHMDAPTDLLLALLDYVKAEGITTKETYKFIAFLESVVDVIAVGGQAIELALEAAFEAKYFFNRVRPEELLNGADFTAYPEGCPCHPSYPAGHGAAAGATFAVVKHFFDLSPDQLALVDEATRQFAHYRTFSGVHYASDNSEGWLLGKRIVEEFLAV